MMSIIHRIIAAVFLAWIANGCVAMANGAGEPDRQPIPSSPTPTTKPFYFPITINESLRFDSIAYDYGPLSFFQSSDPALVTEFKINKFSFFYERVVDTNQNDRQEKRNQLRLQTMFEKNGFDLYYQKFQGFQYEKSSVSDERSVWRQGNNLWRNDMAISSYGFNIFHYVSPRQFSMDAATSLRFIPSIPGWSWVGMISQDVFSVSASDSLIPQSEAHRIGDLISYEGGMVSAILLGGGVGGVYPWGSFVTAAAGSVALGPSISRSHIDNIHPVDEGLAGKFNVRALVGYRIGEILLKSAVYVDLKTTKLHNHASTYQTNYLTIGVDWRLWGSFDESQVGG